MAKRKIHLRVTWVAMGNMQSDLFVLYYSALVTVKNLQRVVSAGEVSAVPGWELGSFPQCPCKKPGLGQWEDAEDKSAPAARAWWIQPLETIWKAKKLAPENHQWIPGLIRKPAKKKKKKSNWNKHPTWPLAATKMFTIYILNCHTDKIKISVRYPSIILVIIFSSLWAFRIHQ